jgi:NADH-quinone oxidoreductase subunit E
MQFTPENKARFEEALKRYPVARSAILPALHLVQQQEGWITTEGIEYVASLLNLTPAQVHDTATYYTMYRFKPYGRTHIEICTNLSCALAGADALLEGACRKLGVAEGEMTPDGAFTVNRVECLAACGGGPAVQVNGEWLENCTRASSSTSRRPRTRSSTR